MLASACRDKARGLWKYAPGYCDCCPEEITD